MIQSFINNKQRIYTSVFLVTFRNSDYGKLAKLGLNILILNITRTERDSFRASFTAGFQNVYVSCEYIYFCPFTQNMVSFLFRVFSNLKPGPLLSLSHPWFLFQIPLFLAQTTLFPSFWLSSHLHISCLQLSSTYSLSFWTPHMSSPTLLQLLISPSFSSHCHERLVSILFPGSQISPSLSVTLPQLQLQILTWTSTRLTTVHRWSCFQFFLFSLTRRFTKMWTLARVLSK